MRVEAVIGRVLVPGDEAYVALILGKGRRSEQQHVRPDQRLHGLNNGRVAGELAHPGERQVGLDLETLVDLLAGLGFVSLDPATQRGGFSRGNSVEREKIAVGLEEIDLLLRQPRAHRSLSYFDTLRIVSMIGAAVK